MIKARRKARALALQTLYEVECANHPAEEVLAQRLKEKPLSAEGERFLRALVTGVLEHAPELDETIARHAPEWPLEQMALVDHCILRMALWEFAIGKETPLKVAINEAVELAKEYGADSAARFVNGVLGAIAAERETV
ncbi:MAG: transcription antitermination factor NusB [Anaerolineales bacterium]|nr:transcription antitermination factor NusB [Anaerolineales bacterium]